MGGPYLNLLLVIVSSSATRVAVLFWAPLCGLSLGLGPSFPVNTSAHPFISLRFLQARLDGGQQHWRPILLAVTEKDLLLFDSVPWTRDAWASPCHSYPLVATRWGKPEDFSRLRSRRRPSGRGGSMNTSRECWGSAAISLWESSRLLGVVGMVWGSDLAGHPGWSCLLEPPAHHLLQCLAWEISTSVNFGTFLLETGKSQIASCNQKSRQLFPLLPCAR